MGFRHCRILGSDHSGKLELVGMTLRELEYAEEKRQQKLYDERLASRPKCWSCMDPIEEEFAWEINGHTYCEFCAEEIFRVFIGD